jgi:hypothetical protein
VPTITGDQFARAVLRAEGMNPDYERELLQIIKERFIERYGEAISARAVPPA